MTQQPTIFFDTAQMVLDCVCAQMDDLVNSGSEYPGCPCWSFVSAGPPEIDCCTTDCGGMLTVHIDQVFPSDLFPQPSQEFQPCKAQTWVASMIVTVARCSPEFDGDNTEPASMEEQTAVAELLAIDQYAIVTALSCCVVADPVGHKSKRRVLIQQSQPQQSSGGCASVEVAVLVEVGSVCSCVSQW